MFLHHAASRDLKSRMDQALYKAPHGFIQGCADINACVVAPLIAAELVCSMWTLLICLSPECIFAQLSATSNSLTLYHIDGSGDIQPFYEARGVWRGVFLSEVSEGWLLCDFKEADFKRRHYLAIHSYAHWVCWQCHCFEFAVYALQSLQFFNSYIC